MGVLCTANGLTRHPRAAVEATEGASEVQEALRSCSGMVGSLHGLIGRKILRPSQLLFWQIFAKWNMDLAEKYPPMAARSPSWEQIGGPLNDGRCVVELTWQHMRTATSLESLVHVTCNFARIRAFPISEGSTIAGSWPLERASLK